MTKQSEAQATGGERPRLFGSMGSPLQGLVKPRTLEPKEVLLVQGTASDSLYLVESGELDVRLDTAEGNVDLGVVGRDGWVGEMGMLVPGPSSATVAARTACQVTPISHARYLDLLTREPRAISTALLSICRDLAQRVREATTALVAHDAKGGLQILPHLKALAGLSRGSVPAATMPARASARTLPKVDDRALVWTLDHLGLFRSDDPAEQGRLTALRKAVTDIALTGLSVQTCLHEEAITEAGSGTCSIISMQVTTSKLPGCSSASCSTVICR